MNTKLLKDKNFILLIMGKLVSLVGSNMQQFALSLYVLDKTGSATIFASMLSISILPRLILSPFAGVFGDWFDRKKSIVILDFINALIIGSFAYIFFINNELSIPMIYILVILLEITEIFFSSAMSGIMPSIVDKDDLLEANSFSSLVLSLGDLLSPIIAALLYARFGMQLLLIVNSISFLLSSISEIFIKMPKSHKTPEKINFQTFITDLKEGFKVIKENEIITTILSLAVVLNFAISPLFSIGFTYIIRDILKVSDYGFSLFQSILSASMLISPLFISKLSKKYKSGTLMYKSFFIISIFIFISSLGTFNGIINASTLISFLIMLISAFSMGFFVTIANIIVGTMANKTIPIEMMGRVMTIVGFFSTILIPIGQMFFGLLYDRLHPSIVTIFIGCIFLTATLKFKIRLNKYNDIELNNLENA